jgi:hypothetical protein
VNYVLLIIGSHHVCKVCSMIFALTHSLKTPAVTLGYNAANSYP